MKIFVDAFGQKHDYIDKGVHKRDIGDIFSVVPRIPGATVEGGSSDHLILDISDSKINLKLGDIVEFEAFYEAMIHSTYSSSVTKKYIFSSAE